MDRYNLKTGLRQCWHNQIALKCTKQQQLKKNKNKQTGFVGDKWNQPTPIKYLHTADVNVFKKNKMVQINKIVGCTLTTV